MKKLLICMAIMTCSCSGWTYNGIRGDDLRNLNTDHLVGGLTSVVVHTAGHYVAAALCGVPMRQDGPVERMGPATSGEQSFIGSAGFGAQLLVGYGIKWFGSPSDFSRGYNMATVIEIGLYPVTDNYNGDGSDLKLMGGNAPAIWGVATAAAVGLNYEFDKKGVDNKAEKD